MRLRDRCYNVRTGEPPASRASSSSCSESHRRSTALHGGAATKSRLPLGKPGLQQPFPASVHLPPVASVQALGSRE